MRIITLAATRGADFSFTREGGIGVLSHLCLTDPWKNPTGNTLLIGLNGQRYTTSLRHSKFALPPPFVFLFELTYCSNSLLLCFSHVDLLSSSSTTCAALCPTQNPNTHCFFQQELLPNRYTVALMPLLLFELITELPWSSIWKLQTLHEPWPHYSPLYFLSLTFFCHLLLVCMLLSSYVEPLVPQAPDIREWGLHLALWELKSLLLQSWAPVTFIPGFSGFQSFIHRLHHTMSFPVSPACQCKSMRLLSICIHISHFLLVNPVHMCMCVHVCLCTNTIPEFCACSSCTQSYSPSWNFILCLHLPISQAIHLSNCISHWFSFSNSPWASALLQI